MITKCFCPGSRGEYESVPFCGYAIGVDFAAEKSEPAIVISKLVPDGEGGVILIPVDVKTRPLIVI